MDLSVFSGSQFLWLYGGLMVGAWLASMGIARWLRPEGSHGGLPAMEELALLAGGRQRYADALIAKLLGEGALEVDGKGFRSRNGAGASSAERAILSQTAPIRYADVTRAIAQDAAALEERLVARGWLMGSGELMQLRLFALIPFGLLLLLGWYRQQAGEALGEPTGMLVFLMIVTLLLALIRFMTASRHTGAGIAALDEAIASGSRLKRAPTEPEMGRAVALYGTAVLAGTSMASFHTMRNSASSGDGGSSGDSGDSGSDGGGYGGGGCGGCGG